MNLDIDKNFALKEVYYVFFKYDLNINDPHFTLIDIQLIYLTSIQVHEQELTDCVCVFVCILYITFFDDNKEVPSSRQLMIQNFWFTTWDVEFIDL